MNRSFIRKLSIIALASLSVSAAVVGCSSSGKTPSGSDQASDVGVVGANIVLAPGIDIAQLTYTITGNGVSISTTIPVTGPEVIFEIALAAGNGYHIKLTAVSTDGKVSCAGEADFNVQSRKTTSVKIVLQCTGTGVRPGKVRVDGTFDFCPVVLDIVASPISAPLGGTIQLAGSAADSDVADVLTYTWSAPSGTFGTPSAVNTSYRCTAVGVQTITFSVSDGTCNDQLTQEVVCTAGGTGGAGGSTGTGGAPGTGGATTGGTPGTGGATTGGTPGTDGATTGGSAGKGGAGAGGASGGSAGTTGTGGTVGNPVCNACTTANCAAEKSACANATGVAAAGPAAGQSKQSLCLAVRACVDAHPTCVTSLSSTACYCGPGVSISDCQTLGPSAASPCRNEIEAAAETTVSSIVSSRYVNPAYAVGLAMLVSSCQQDACTTECFP